MIQLGIPRGQHPSPRAKSQPSGPCRDIETPLHEKEPRWKTSFRKLDDPLQLEGLRSVILPLLSARLGSR